MGGAVPGAVGAPGQDPGERGKVRTRPLDRWMFRVRTLVDASAGRHGSSTPVTTASKLFRDEEAAEPIVEASP